MMPNDGMMFIRLPQSLLATITEQARCGRLSRSEYVRRVLTGYIAGALRKVGQEDAGADIYVKRLLRKGLTYMSGNSLKRNILSS